VTDRLGAQGTVLGGGRYDGLIEALGGPHTPAVGWAAGIERLAMLVGERGEAALDVVVVAESASQEIHALSLVSNFRRAGISSEIIATGSPRKRFDRAKKLNPSALVSFDFREGSNWRSLKILDATLRASPLINEVFQAFLLGEQLGQQ